MKNTNAYPECSEKGCCQKADCMSDHLCFDHGEIERYLEIEINSAKLMPLEERVEELERLVFSLLYRGRMKD
jgi:hypothetical protein